MSRLPALLVCLAVTGCSPWNHISGPTVGARVVYQEDRGVSPEIDAGYAFERYEGFHGYGGDARVGWEPWRNRVSATALARGSLAFWEVGIGPTVSWSPDGMTYGLTFTASIRLAQPAPGTCGRPKGPDGAPSNCLGPSDTVYPRYVPRLHFDSSFLRDRTIPMAFGADVILSTYFLRHGKKRPTDDR